ncbi:MAG: N-acetyltransferase [Acidimicrobiales bacterium]|nr:N-acetyltransferase [Acidimicrobiales bacterium]
MDVDIDLRSWPDGGRYRLLVDGEEVGELDYDERDGRRVLAHTGVHRSHRGHGLAARLVRRALDDARRDEVRVVPVCWYVVAYLDEHPEDRDLVHRPESGG